MLQVIATIAHMLPTEVIVEQLEESIGKYKQDQTEKNYHLVAQYCNLFLIKASINLEGGFSHFLNELNQLADAKKLLDNDPLKQ